MDKYVLLATSHPVDDGIQLQELFFCLNLCQHTKSTPYHAGQVVPQQGLTDAKIPYSHPRLKTK